MYLLSLNAAYKKCLHFYGNNKFHLINLHHLLYSFSGFQLCNCSLETKLKAEKPAQDYDISILRYFFFFLSSTESFKAAVRESEGENSLGRQFSLMSQRSSVFLWKYSTGHFSENRMYCEPLTFFIYNFWMSGVAKEIADNSSSSLEVKEISKGTHAMKCRK